MTNYIHKVCFFLFLLFADVLISRSSSGICTILKLVNQSCFRKYSGQNERLEVLGEFLLDLPRNGYWCFGGGWVWCSGRRVWVTRGHGWWHGVRWVDLDWLSWVG